MPEQFLNTAQVRARIEQMRGITVPELVRREIRIQTGQRQIFFQTKLQLPRRDCVAMTAFWFPAASASVALKAC